MKIITLSLCTPKLSSLCTLEKSLLKLTLPLLISCIFTQNIFHATHFPHEPFSTQTIFTQTLFSSNCNRFSTKSKKITVYLCTKWNRAINEFLTKLRIRGEQQKQKHIQSSRLPHQLMTNII